MEKLNRIINHKEPNPQHTSVAIAGISGIVVSQQHSTKLKNSSSEVRNCDRRGDVIGYTLTSRIENENTFKMENESSKIKFEEHFKLYVLLKDKITFESELLENGVDFYFEEKQPNITSGIRYFLRDVDRPKIDKIVIENGIIASTETIPSYDYRDQQKAQKIYAITACVVVVIILIVFAIVELFKKEHWL